MKRSVPVPDKKRLEGRHARWEKITREAVKQCRRSRPMRIEPVRTFQETLELAESYERKFIFYEDATSVLSPDPVGSAKPAGVFVLIGPEGGFDRAEVDTARQKGFVSLGMGPRILKAETAALTAGALLQFAFGDMGGAADQNSP